MPIFHPYSPHTKIHLIFLLISHSSPSTHKNGLSNGGGVGELHATKDHPVDGGDPLARIQRLASENAVVIFSMSTCCMCHAIKRLFCAVGVNPTVYELDEDPRGKDLERALMRLLGGSPAVPLVFVGGKLVGPMDRVMACHINGSLVPLLKDAGALWL